MNHDEPGEGRGDELGRLLRAHWQDQDDTVTDVAFTGPQLRARVGREHVGQVRRLVVPAAAALVAAAAAGVLWLGSAGGSGGSGHR